ncbi:MAG TPA: hypothetical protein PK156_31920 [Polyangium sp.]|nr:hypothetical protein [Polyangium sp.]
MLKRILNTLVHSAAAGTGAVIGVRGGNDVYNWVKSGEAKTAAKKLINGIEQSATNQIAALQDRSGVRARVSAEAESTEERSNSRDEASELEQLSEDDIAALQARRNTVTESVTVRCTHCHASKQVPRDTELTQCTDCGKRFWVELADRG